MVKLNSILFLVLMVLGHKSYGIINFGSEDNQKYLLKKFGRYDSVFLMHSTSFWACSYDVFIVGFKHGQLNLLKGKIHLKKDRSTFSRIKLKRIEYSQKENLSNFNVNTFQSLNHDSLNNFFNNKTKLRELTSDGDEYSIVGIATSNKIVVRESYMPVDYQKISPNQDRAYFIALLSDYNRLFNLNWKLD